MGVTRTARFVALAAALCCFGSSAYAATLVYNDTATNGTSTYPGTLVETFTVGSAGLDVTALAAFDSGKNGISTNIMVGLYDDTAGTVVIAPVNFNGTAYNGTSGSYFDTKSLSTPYQLINGHTYSIEAWGFATGNTFLLGAGSVSFNNGGYSLTNVPGTSASTGDAATNIDGTTTGGLFNALYGNTTAYSTYAPYNTNPCFGATVCTTDGPILRFNGTDFAAAGSLVIRATPLPGALPLFAGGLGAFGLLGWRRKRTRAATLAA